MTDKEHMIQACQALNEYCKHLEKRIDHLHGYVKWINIMGIASWCVICFVAGYQFFKL